MYHLDLCSIGGAADVLDLATVDTGEVDRSTGLERVAQSLLKGGMELVHLGFREFRLDPIIWRAIVALGKLLANNDKSALLEGDVIIRRAVVAWPPNLLDGGLELDCESGIHVLGESIVVNLVHGLLKDLDVFRGHVTDSSLDNDMGLVSTGGVSVVVGERNFTTTGRPQVGHAGLTKAGTEVSLKERVHLGHLVVINEGAGKASEQVIIRLAVVALTQRSTGPGKVRWKKSKWKYRLDEHGRLQEPIDKMGFELTR